MVWGGVAGVGRRAATASDAEPVQNVVGLNRNIVVYISSTDGLEIGSVG